MNLRYTGTMPEKEVFEIIGETFEELFNADPKVVYIDADLMGSIKTQNLWEKYPNNVFNTGIQEANMIGLACGLFLNGFKPYVHTFTPFATRRVFDQLAVSVAYAHKGVRVIGSDAGIMATHNGGTHMCFEDIAMVRALPEACIIDVSDPTMCKAFMKLTKDRIGLTYIRTPRRNLKDIYEPDTKFEIGKGKILREGTDITLVASGIMVATCLEAAKLLEKDSISAKVVDIVTIKPLDEELVLHCAKTTKGIITAENANIIGGLGSAVSEYLSSVYPTRVIRIGVEDKFGAVGEEEFLRNKYGLTVDNVVAQAKNILEGAYRYV
ncbi:transketolase C-terminal domain-containing protein [Phascolarctobacterium faecium]|nr:transketolase C-terminal domain-containing protein [Phascolarctobacterium faecium]MDM8110970.1 transketolase C-terminal domain-containing protein [Phascolarctobacterium faecium]